MDLIDRSIDELNLSPEQRSALLLIKHHVDQQYAERFVEMRELMVRQHSALERLQRTIEILLDRLDPKITEDARFIGLQIVPDGERPDLATTAVVADPIGMGFVLSQTDIANALGISQPDASILARAFIKADPHLAIEVRRGKATLRNYHSKAVEALRGRIRNADVDDLTDTVRGAVIRARRSIH